MLGPHGEFWQFLGKFRPSFGEGGWTTVDLGGDLPEGSDRSTVILYRRALQTTVVGQAEGPGRFMRLADEVSGWMVSDASVLPADPYVPGMAAAFAWDPEYKTLTAWGRIMEIWWMGGGLSGYGIYVQRPGEGIYVHPLPARHDPLVPSFEDIKASPSASLNLRCVDFRGEDCRGLIAPHSDFSYANLTAVEFTGGDLTNSNFSNAILNNARLAGGKFDGCSFPNAQLVSADVRGVNFGGVNLSGANLTDVTCDASTRIAGQPGALTNLSGATLPFRLLGKDWSYIDLTDATITDVPRDLSGLKAMGTRFSRKVSLKKCDLSGAQLQGAWLHGVTLNQANLEGADLSGAQLGALDDVGGAKLNFAYLANVKMQGANLYAAHLSGATWYGANTNVVDAILESADLSNAYVAGIDLRGAKMRGAIFDGACLINAQFDGADVQAIVGAGAASFVGAWLQGASFSGAKLDKVDFTGAFVAAVKGTQMVQYYDDSAELYPANDDYRPLTHGPTTGLGPDTMLDKTTCPNGDTVADNLAAHVSWAEMLKSLHALPAHWSPGLVPD